MQYTIRFDNGAHFKCADDRAVALAMKQAGLKETIIGCRGGGCGVCRVRVLEGRYDTAPMSREHISEADQRAGYVLGCCLFPRSDLLLSVTSKPSRAQIGISKTKDNNPKPHLRLV